MSLLASSPGLRRFYRAVNIALLLVLLSVATTCAYVAHTYGWDCVQAGGELFKSGTEGLCSPLPPDMVPAGAE